MTSIPENTFQLPTTGFHVGVNNRNKCKKAKRNKPVKPVKPVKTVNPVNPEKSNKLSYETEKPRYIFEAYVGPRWFVPYGKKVSPNVRSKFESLSTYSRDEVFKQIKYNSVHNMCNISGFPNPYNIKAGEYISSPAVNTILKKIKSREKNEWNQVYSLYTTVFRFATMFNKIRHMAKVYRTMKNRVNAEDPVTLEVAKKPVYVLNLNRRCSYVYEANTIRRAMENRLLTCYWMFNEPKQPMNILSNEDLVMGQYISILRQLKEYGEFSVTLELFRNANFDLSVFEKRNKQYLKLKAIEYHFKDEISASKTTVTEFIKVMSVGRVI
ncbi:hypothetical protein EBV26_15445, partial [bacterium]|nr:hypothetical protein [bacterium]